MSQQETSKHDEEAEFAAKVRKNQEKLARELGRPFAFVVCGAGTSGSVVAQ